MLSSFSLKVLELFSDRSGMSLAAPRFLYDSSTGTYIRVVPGLVLGRNCCLTFAQDVRMSREHLQFQMRGDTLFVVDLFSTNGVRLNDLAVPQNTRIAVREHDILAFGSQRLVLVASTEVLASSTPDRILTLTPGFGLA